MQSTVEETDKHVVRLEVEVPPEEFGRDVERTYRKLAQQIRIPGFRKGKVPRQIIDTRLGREAVFHEWIEEFLPAYYTKALREHDLAPIADPDIDLEGAHEIPDRRPFRFTATVEVRPRLELSSEQYAGVHVEAPSTEPRELEIDEYVDHLRERFAELEVVSRPALKGDFVLADVRAYVNDRDVPEASRVGFLTEVGAEDLVPELDRELEGTRKGDILKFNAVLPESFGDLAGTEVSFQVLVKEVKSKRLPAADDEFAKTASEFDTMDELREDIRTRLRALKEAESRSVIRDLVLREVIDAVDVDLPERMVDEETERRVENAQERATQSGYSLQEALEAQGWDELRFRADARAHAVRAIMADLVLEAVARQEELTITDEDLANEVAALAEATGRDAKEVARMIERSGQVATLAGDIIRTKALDHLVEHADVTTTGGIPAEAEPEGEPAEETTPEPSES